MDKEQLYNFSASKLEGLEPMKDIFDLSGKVAVISGSVGLAHFIMHRLLEAGACVVFGSRTQLWGDKTIETFNAMGYDNLAFKQTDVRKVEDCQALVSFAEETFGPVDIVIPVAATWQACAFLDVDEALYDNIVDTDAKGQYFLIQAAARSMVKAGKGGKVVAIASVAYRADDMFELAMMTPYNTAKGAVTSMTKGIAKELKQYGINVNCIAPGGMGTPGAISNNNETMKQYGPDWVAKQREGGHHTPVAKTPDEVARMVLVMCTSVSDFMYGKVIDVDGGSDLSFQKEPWSYTMPGGKCAAHEQ